MKLLSSDASQKAIEVVRRQMIKTFNSFPREFSVVSFLCGKFAFKSNFVVFALWRSRVFQPTILARSLSCVFIAS